MGLWLGTARVSGEAPETAVDQSVERLYASLIDAMKHAQSLGYAGRYEKLAPVIDETYDLPFVAEKSLGRHWKRLSEEQRLRWVETFSQFTISTYAERFHSYSGERFEVMDTEPSLYETFIVRSRLVKPGRDPVRLDYRLRQRDGRWRIIDVYLNGTVSQLALRRSEYSGIMKREGFEALVQALVEKIRANRGR
ncbi:MAG: ABC transporter substrate-binding protein [Candidatus Acidoferrales bacterium]